MAIYLVEARGSYLHNFKHNYEVKEFGALIEQSLSLIERPAE